MRSAACVVVIFIIAAIAAIDSASFAATLYGRGCIVYSLFQSIWVFGLSDEPLVVLRAPKRMCAVVRRAHCRHCGGWLPWIA